LETERAAYQEFARHVQEQVSRSAGQQVSRSAGQQVRVLNVLEAPGLSQDLYRDGIHPSPTGNTYLASLIAASIRTTEP
jgi:lysophospholipase L1-like esterase